MSGDSLTVGTRPVEPGDEPFLFEVYSSTRALEMAQWGWGAAQQEAFLRLQFNGQQGFYRMQYPEAEHQIILLGDEPVGRMIVISTKNEIRLADIVVLPEFRNRGIGASLIRDLCDEAERRGLPVRLRVLKSNLDAARLYERMGFSADGDSETHFDMMWRSGTR